MNGANPLERRGQVAVCLFWQRLTNFPRKVGIRPRAPNSLVMYPLSLAPPPRAVWGKKTLFRAQIFAFFISNTHLHSSIHQPNEATDRSANKGLGCRIGPLSRVTQSSPRAHGLLPDCKLDFLAQCLSKTAGPCSIYVLLANNRVVMIVITKCGLHTQTLCTRPLVSTPVVETSSAMVLDF